MRTLAGIEKIEEFMERFGLGSLSDTHVYFTGGATAVLYGWRESTIDVDISFLTENDDLLKMVPAIKEKLQLNVELASPPDFIPEVPGWETRSKFIRRKGKVSFYHYDLYSQALSKIERSHAQDIVDVQAMMDRGLVDRQKLAQLFSEIEPYIYKYPAINPAKFAESVRAATGF